MDDEQTVETTTEATPETTAVETPPAAPAPEVAAPDWRSGIDGVDPAELIKHPRIAGILGSRIERERQAISERIAADAAAKAQADAQAELERLATDDPEEFSRRWLGHTEQQKIQAQLDTVKATARDEYTQRIGAAFNQIPEWREIATDQKAQEKLATALAGKADDEVIATFNATAIDLVVEKRAAAKAKTEYDAQIAKEREAMRAEIIAEINRSGVAPGVYRSNGAPSGDPLDSLPVGPDFDKAYKRRYGLA